MDIKLIKSEADYDRALEELDRLMVSNPDKGSSDGDRLELLAHVIEVYEDEHYPIDLPDPVEAIRFCMDQQGLSQRDLIPYIGSRSKVSEVLSGKRPLSLSMIRELNKHLNIPAEVLLQKPGAKLEEDVEWHRFPLKDMVKRKWLKAAATEIKENAEEIVRAFVEPVGGLNASPVMCRRNIHIRAPENRNPYALEAWRARVARRSLEAKLEPYRADMIDREALTALAKLSRPHNGPMLARDYLLGLGVVLVVEEHLPGTYLDGAAFMGPTGHPVIGLTLRYDRIDNFWFTLMHELAHVALHLPLDHIDFIMDNLEVEAADDFEREADQAAQEALIPEEIWRDSGACNLGTADYAIELADQLKIHPAIVAGRIRRQEGNYKKLNQLVGHGVVREMFR